MTQIQRRFLLWRALWLLCFAVLWRDTKAQLRYTIPEELKEGSVVGNVAKDLGLDVSEISNRKRYSCATYLSVHMLICSISIKITFF
uniref:Cadherin N-terminal domain-containing protein n=1 Tax=Sinocyclocheilus anshuiensis TaxID=1608454 RepID=A0A671QDI4_9TELE